MLPADLELKKDTGFKKWGELYKSDKD